MTCRQKRVNKQVRRDNTSPPPQQVLIQDGCRTTVQQSGQNHHSRTRVSRSIRMSRAMATNVPSDCKDRRDNIDQVVCLGPVSALPSGTIVSIPPYLTYDAFRCELPYSHMRWL